MKIKCIYGPHPSRCWGYSLGIDPLMPPRKCPYNCIYCPIIPWYFKKTLQPQLYVSPERISQELDEFIQLNGCVYNTIMIWGMGDPLLNFQTPLIIEKVKTISSNYGCSERVVLRTTGYLLAEKWVEPIFRTTDYILIPLDVVGEPRKLLVDPLDKASIYSLRKIMRSLPKYAKRKIYAEINMFRNEWFNPGESRYLLELAATLKSIGINKVFLKTINRPGRSRDIKPLRGKLLDKARRILEEEGIDVKMCGSIPEQNIILAGDVEESIYNHVLRKPLSVKETIKVYGNEGVVYAERLVEQGRLEKINWSSEIYFIPKKGLDIFMGG